MRSYYYIFNHNNKKRSTKKKIYTNKNMDILFLKKQKKRSYTLLKEIINRLITN